MNYTKEDVERERRKAQSILDRLINQPPICRCEEDDCQAAKTHYILTDELKTVRAALSSISRHVPEGWVLVPKEPTLEMIKAGSSHRGDYASNTYAAMLASAPPHPKEDRRSVICTQ